MKALVKQLLHKSGLTALLHRVRNRDTLTVLMLHRVLPPDLIESYGANPEWTMTPQVLTDFIRFLKRHYNPVSAQEVEAHINNEQSLPPRALLLSFDDGWKDNHEFAQQILIQEEMPAIIFVVSDTINQHMPFWQELIFSCCARSKNHRLHCLTLAGMDPSLNATSLISELSNNPEQAQNKAAILKYCHEQNEDLPRQLISSDELKELFENGIEIGSHGATHNKLGTMNPSEQANELSTSRKKLTKIINSDVRYLSFPHGSHDDKTSDIAFEAGYRVMYSSRIRLNKTNATKNILARIHVAQASISQSDKFSPFKSSYILFFVSQE
jgi:peptidoglycan/xylan/chitin deacetylase (PgdA/CDA1 family)